MHFLKQDELPVFGGYAADVIPGWTGKGWACATVKLLPLNQLEVQEGVDSIGILRPDTRLAPLPDRMTVVSKDGKIIRPSPGRRFYVTTETFNPFHAVTEVQEIQHEDSNRKSRDRRGSVRQPRRGG